MFNRSALIPVPFDDLPCLDCGVIVPGPLPEEAIHRVTPTLYESSRPTPEGVTVHPIRRGIDPATGLDAPPPTVPLALCSTCEETRHLAHTLTSQHFPHGVVIEATPMNTDSGPGTVSLRHTGEEAEKFVRLALAACDALGMHIPTADTPPERLAILVRRLGLASVEILFSRQYAPVRRTFSVEGYASPERWGHLPEEMLTPLRSAYASLLAADLAECAPDVRLTPPAHTTGHPATPLGCAYCGLSHVMMNAREVAERFNGSTDWATREVWNMRRIPPSSIGGRMSPDLVPMFLCPDCDEATQREGAVGMDAAERSLFAFLGLGTEVRELPDLRGAWAAQPGRAPTPTRWAFLGKPEDVRLRVRALGPTISRDGTVVSDTQDAIDAAENRIATLEARLAAIEGVAR